ncbi:hypothetical protein F2Q69_00040357, partial [Brassica cretica]
DKDKGEALPENRYGAKSIASARDPKLAEIALWLIHPDLSQWWSANAERLLSCIALFTRSLFVGNAFASRSIKPVWYVHQSLMLSCYPDLIVRTYSEWVIDGEYDQPKCCQCQSTFDEGGGLQVTRLGCLHAIHTTCLVSLIKSFPPHTAPAGYICPSCSTTIWPPKMVKDAGSRLHAQLREAILLTGLEKNLFGNHPVSRSTESRSPPPAFASDALINVSSSSHTLEGKNLPDGYSVAGNGEYSKSAVSEIVEIDVPASAGNYMKTSSPGFAAAAARKGVPAVDRQNSETLYYADDEDGNKKKYSRRGPLRHKFLRALLPFWSNALPTLPVTAPPRKDATKGEDGSEGRSMYGNNGDLILQTCATDENAIYGRLSIFYVQHFVCSRVVSLRESVIVVLTPFDLTKKKKTFVVQDAIEDSAESHGRHTIRCLIVQEEFIGYIAEHPNDEEEVEGIDLHQQRYPWEGSDMDYLYDESSFAQLLSMELTLEIDGAIFHVPNANASSNVDSQL